MFFDIGPLELLTLIILGVLLFGPDKLPEIIQNVTGFLRKVREFSDNAKAEIRSELGPEYKDFEFEDLNPKTFVRKQLIGDDDLGLAEIRDAFDMRRDVTDEAPSAAPTVDLSKGANPRARGGDDSAAPDHRPPFDSEAT